MIHTDPRRPGNVVLTGDRDKSDAWQPLPEPIRAELRRKPYRVTFDTTGNAAQVPASALSSLLAQWNRDGWTARRSTIGPAR